MQSKGIYCIETDWDFENTKNCSVAGILKFLKSCEGIQYKHIKLVKDTETFMNQLRSYNDNIRQYQSKYPILYIASHGRSGAVCVRGKNIYLDEIGDVLRDVFNQHDRKGIIVLGSCKTANINISTITDFIDDTGAFAFIGYKNDADFSYSVTTELLLMLELQNNEFSMNGYCAILRNVQNLQRMFNNSDDQTRNVGLCIHFRKNKECTPQKIKTLLG